jgi:hypothetical protein
MYRDKECTELLSGNVHLEDMESDGEDDIGMIDGKNYRQLSIVSKFRILCQQSATRVL